MNTRLSAFLLAAATAAAAPLAQATPYQVELEAGYTDINPDVGAGDSLFDLRGSFYFAPVATDSRPLAEAGFLGHASNVSAA